MNADNNDFEDGESHETRATRIIEPGEQIYISYNRCEVCGDRDIGYGSAGMSVMCFDLEEGWT